MARGGEETERLARQALEELVKIRGDKVQRLEQRIQSLEAHVQDLLRAYSVSTFPPGYDPAVVNDQRGLVEGPSEREETVGDTHSSKRQKLIRHAPILDHCGVGHCAVPVPIIDTSEESNDGKETRHPFAYVDGRQTTLDSFFKGTQHGVDQEHQVTLPVPVSYVMARKEACPRKSMIVVPGKASRESDCRAGTGSVVRCEKVPNLEDVEAHVVTWKPSARPADSSSSSGSSASSGESMTSEQGEEYEEVTKDTRDSNGTVQLLGKSTKERAALLSPDASTDDCFDWTVLGVLSSIIWPERYGNCHQQGEPMVPPLRYFNEAQYSATFRPLIIEECRAIFENDWAKVKKEMGLRRSSSAYKLPPVQACPSLWHFQYLPIQDEPFSSFKGNQESGPPAEHCEIMVLASRQTLEVNALAIVQNVFDNEILIRTRECWGTCAEQCLVLKISNLVTMKRMYSAVSSLPVLHRCLSSQVLKPCFGTSPASPRPAFMAGWEAANLFNHSQLSAIAAAVNLTGGFLLVQGPPGTGKTTTILGMVSALLIQEPGIRILVCTGSNPALDEVVSRLMCGMLDGQGERQPPAKGVIVRVGPRNKVRKDCLDVYMDQLRLRQRDAPTRALAIEWTLKTASVVCSTLSGSRHPQLDDLRFNFDIAIVDEAAQSAEPEVIIALKKVAGRCILVGDPRQLPATVMQQPATAFGRSLFERMQDADVPVHLLNTQYRMHPEISWFPSKQFYNGVVDDADQLHRMKPIFQWAGRHQWVSSGGYDFELGRFSFLDVKWGSHEKDLTSASLLNREEVSVVVAIVQGVVTSLVPGVKAKVGVITPYAAQKKRILDELARIQVDETVCEVDTVDGFQGREKDVIIVSCVRAGSPKRGMGFLSDARRLCVALTRAKHSLIIVGHVRTLGKDRLWSSLIGNAYERNCLKALRRS